MVPDPIIPDPIIPMILIPEIYEKVAEIKS